MNKHGCGDFGDSDAGTYDCSTWRAKKKAEVVSQGCIYTSRLEKPLNGRMNDDLPATHMPIFTPNALIKLPTKITIFPSATHARLPYRVEIKSPMNAVNTEGRKKDAAMRPRRLPFG